jgi:hypothetical protein
MMNLLINASRDGLPPSTHCFFSGGMEDMVGEIGPVAGGIAGRIYYVDGMT